MDTKHCVKCNKILRSDWNVCPACGTTVIAPEPTPEAAVTTATEAPAAEQKAAAEKAAANRKAAEQAAAEQKKEKKGISPWWLLLLIPLLAWLIWLSFRTPAPTATKAPAPAANTSNCRDGSPTGNPKNRIDRTPVGLAKFWTVQEISVKPGTGFTGFDRWIQVTAPLGDTDQVFNLNVETIHEVEYCGTREAVIAYLSDVSTHVWAMRQSAVDSLGLIPPEGEIPVVLVDSTTGTVTFLVAPTANSAPTLELIKSHIEVVHLQQ